MTYGKYVLIPYIVIIFTYFILFPIKRNDALTFIYFTFLIFTMIWGMINGLFHKNSFRGIIRDFNYVFYVIIPFVLLRHYKTVTDIEKFLSKLIKYISITLIPFVFLYFLGMLSKDILHLINNLSSSFGMSVRYIDMWRINLPITPLKTFTFLSSMFIFLVPIAYFSNYTHKVYLFILVFFILLSISLAQYAILFLYTVCFISLFLYKRFINKSLKFSKKVIINIVLILILFMITFRYLPYKYIFDGIVYKYNESISQKTKTINTYSIRFFQAEILINEIKDKPILGHGLGYESEKYAKFIKKNKKNVKLTKEGERVNIAMYENQYLDILLKFGIIGGLIILIIYAILPFYILLKLQSIYRTKIFWGLIIGFVGFLIFIGTNGNLFYSPFSMIVWGLIITIIFKFTNTKNFY
jgi:O-antigen ligase